MPQELCDWQKTGYDTVLWLAEELRQRDPKVTVRGQAWCQWCAGPQRHRLL